MKRRILSLITCMAVLFTAMSIGVTVRADANFSGSGTEADPYLIGTASDLTTLASLTNASATASTYADKYYKLTADLDMTGINYMPISWGKSMYTPEGARFTGTLDGDGHIIKNITIPITYAQNYGSAVGVIGILGANGTVKNLGVENMAVTTGGTSNPTHMCIGGIAGSLMANVSIDRCYVKGMTVTATTAGTPCFVGGLSGTTISDGSTFTNCYTTGLSFTVTKDASHKAGILGACGNSNCSATNCYTTDSKIMGNIRSGTSNLGTTKCYTSSTITDATATNLGAAFQDDTNLVNSGHPLLAWEKNYAFLGAGTQADPYLIGTASDLTTLATLTNAAASASTYADKYYKLTADIDMTGISYKPISWGHSLLTAQGASFTGTLDGDGHIIKNITINSNLATYGATGGLIGVLGTNGVVKNLGIENMSITTTASSTYLCIGGIAGSLMANVSIDRCYVKGMTVSATSAGFPCFVGGLSGTTISAGGAITNCYTSGLSFTVTSDAKHKAGILGGCGSSNCSATNCYTTDSKIMGNIRSGSSDLGTTNCYTSGTIADATATALGTTAFKSDIYGKNNSYPLLTWEVDLAGSLSLTQSGETLTANANVMNRTGASQSVFVIICQFDSLDSYMVSCEVKKVTVANGASVADAVQMAVSGEAGIFRAYLWESGRLIPLTDYEEI